MTRFCSIRRFTTVKAAVASLAALCLLAPATRSAAAPVPQTLEQAATRYLQGVAVNTGLDGHLGVTLNQAASNRLAGCASPRFERVSNRPLSSFETLAVSCPGDSTLTGVAYLQAVITLTASYAVATQEINAGSAIARTDISVRTADILRLPQDARQPPSSWIGMVATRRIPAGTPLRGSEVRSAQSVARGEVVRLVYQIPGLRVTNSATALSNADVGAMVRVKTSNGQIVSGRVADDGTVRVQP
ncbi:MAG: flagellar basal body P-ring formation protein FlgA [Candidimonas sp.]|nr:MAG: flagellar basal body P-ring formation protein FlgA [Candidimonas sp.]